MKASIFATALAVAGLFVSGAQAAEVYAGGVFQSAYVASGVTVNDGWVFQPYVEATGFKLGDVELPISLGFWGNLDLEDSYDEVYKSGRFSEIDLSIQLSLAQLFDMPEEYTFYIGYLEYDYPRIGAETDNLIDAKFGYKCFLNPAIRLKYRFGGNSKGMFEVIPEISHSFELTEKFGLTLAADAVYSNVDDKDDAVTDSGFACADFTAKLTYGCFNTYCTYVWRLDDDVLPSGMYGYDVKWIAGVGFDFAF